MGLFSFLGKKTKQTQTSNQTSNVSGSTRPVAPDFAQQPIEDLTGQIAGFSKFDPSSFVAGADPLQVQAGKTAGALTSTPWNFDAALGLTGGIANSPAAHTAGATAKGYIPDYLSGYTKDVYDTALNDFDTDAGHTRAQQALDLAGAGAFGGSGAALTQSMTEGELARARAATGANILDTGYTRALGAAQADAQREQGSRDLNAQLYAQNQDRALSAAGQIANIASLFAGNQRSDVATQLGAGEALRGVANDQAQAPLNLASWSVDNLRSLISPFIGADTTGATNTTGTATGTSTTSDPLGTAAKAAQIAALFAGSDIRLKRDIRRVGTLPSGLGVYTWQYVWGGARCMGVMAQEVLGVNPAAVHMHPSGFLMVDYAQL